MKEKIKELFKEYYKDETMSVVELEDKVLALFGVSNSLEQTIFVTNSSPNDVYAAFDSKNRSKIESEESGCYVTEITLYKGERL